MSYWTVNIWSDDTKTTQLVTGASNVSRVSRDRVLMDHHTYEVDLLLEDKAVQNVTKGTYVEVLCGLSSPQLWLNGYVETLTENDASNDITLSLNDPSKSLDFFIDTANFDMKYGPTDQNGVVIYGWVLDAYNGRADGAGAYPPGRRGILTGSGWQARYVDPRTTVAASTTLSSGYAAGTGTITVASTAGMTTNHVVRINGKDCYRLVSFPSGNQIQLSPSTLSTYTAGQTVEDLGYLAPGAGDSWQTSNYDAWGNSIILCQHYNFYLRPAWSTTSPNTAHNGILEFGPLNDTTGSPEIWGGTALATQQGRASAAFNFQPDLAAAQASGYAVIAEADYSEDLSRVQNIYWGIGKGEKPVVNVGTLAGGPPADSNNNPINGWASYQPVTGGRLYFTKGGVRSTYTGHTYSFIATQQQDQGWYYGAVDTTSVTSFGPREAKLIVKVINDASWLLSALLGHIDYNSDPVPRWAFTVQHPLTSASGIPNIPNPGEAITVHYSQEIHDSSALDATTSDSTYGQYIDTGSFTATSYPGPYGTTTERQAKIKRLVEISDEWSGNQFTSTYTLGRGKWHSKYVDSHLATQLEQKIHEKRHATTFQKKRFHNVPGYASQNPTCWEDSTQAALILSPGAYWLYDVPDATYFTNHHKIRVRFAISDATQIFRLIFSKAVDASITSLTAPSRLYGVVQVAFGGSGAASGIFTTTNGSVFTARGQVMKNAAMNSSRRMNATGTFDLWLAWIDNAYEAWISYQDPKKPTGVRRTYRFAHWNDSDGAGNQRLGVYGSLGYWLSGGSTNCTVTDVNAQPHHALFIPRASVAVTHMDPAHPGSGHSTRPTASSALWDDLAILHGAIDALGLKGNQHG